MGIHNPAGIRRGAKMNKFIQLTLLATLAHSNEEERPCEVMLMKVIEEISGMNLMNEAEIPDMPFCDENGYHYHTQCGQYFCQCMDRVTGMTAVSTEGYLLVDYVIGEQFFSDQSIGFS